MNKLETKSSINNQGSDKFQTAVERGRSMAETTNNVIDKFKNDPKLQELQANLRKKFPVDAASKVDPSKFLKHS